MPAVLNSDPPSGKGSIESIPLNAQVQASNDVTVGLLDPLGWQLHVRFNSLAQPSGLFTSGDKLYFTDPESSALRVLDKAGNITTLIGKGLLSVRMKDACGEKFAAHLVQ